MKRSLFFMFAVGLVSAGWAPFQRAAIPAGRISGTVFCETGEPVAGAMVHAEFTDGRPRPGGERWIEADRDGRFTIDSLDWGPYEVYGRKEAAGYANQSYSVHRPSGVPIVTLSPDRPAANVNVFIGPKAGVVVASISDAVTGQHVYAAITIWIWGDEHTGVGGNGEPVDQTMVPANTEVGYEVTAPGYYPWRYSATDPTGASGGTPLNLKPSQKVKIDVKLRPMPK
jgi:hypothetical protein